MTDPILTISKTDPRYPARMRGLLNMPSTLYVLGALPDERQPTVGIVGARLCDQYGKKTAQDFAEILAKNGVQIISGMAIGIDSLAQKGALAGGGRSFAVLGSGVDVCYPQGNRTLYNALLMRGGILSEQKPGTPPLRRNFPLRNRLISALSDLVLVVEAKAKSGSLITVDYALEQGKTVFAVPGRVGDALSDGCNDLIAQGAGIATSPETILEELTRLGCFRDPPAAPHTTAAAARQAKEKRVLAASTLSPEAKQLYQLLDWNDVRSSDLLQMQSRIPISTVSAALTELQLAGLIAMPSPGHYLRQ